MTHMLQRGLPARQQRPALDLDLVWMAGHGRRQIDPDLFRLLEAIKQTG